MKVFNAEKELKKSERKISKKQIIISLSVLMAFAVIGMSFALFNLESKEYIVFNGRVGDFTNADIKLAVLVDGAAQDSFPAKGSGYAFQSVTCDNGSTGIWDDSAWELSVNFSGPDNCVVSFITKSGDDPQTKLEGLLAANPTTMNNDDPDGNIRYIGASPNNYVSFNGETNWRIIGVFNVKNATTGVTEQRMKIIRDTIGNYSWDSSASGVNNGYGINEWSQADIMTTLNSGAYWNRTSGTCYSGSSNSTTTCDFSSTGLTAEAKAMISDTAVWNLGTTTNDWSSSSTRTETASQMYAFERSTNTGKICSSGTYCNDSVTRTTTWNGKVGLMYPSDYAYSTAGGSTSSRATCLNTALYSWSNATYDDCHNNSWLYNSSLNQWTLTPVPYSSGAYHVFYVTLTGYVYNYYRAYFANAVRPVVYLNSSVVIVDGDGTSDNPFVLE